MNERDRLDFGTILVSSVATGSYGTSSTAKAVQDKENTIARANTADRMSIPREIAHLNRSN